MRPATDRSAWRRVALMLLMWLPLIAPATRPPVALASRVDNPHGRFRENCQLCHDARSWSDVHVSPKFDHAKYGFKLEGAHAGSDCMSCHASLEFAQAPALCASCHADPHRGEMGTDCARCHSARTFVDRMPMVRAHQMTRFPLTGSHAALDCESCHPPAAQGHMQFAGTTIECSGCHMDQYRAARNPDHVAGGYPTQCGNCHATMTWTSASFNHATTRFPLTGAHVPVACARCHADGVYAGKSTACFSCHAAAYAGASPPHTPAAFPTAACASCHTTTAWNTPFDHNATRFPLTGAHAPLACASCHADGVYAGKSTDCYSCHASTYAGASPPHTATAFPPSQCATCHGTTAWSGGSFNHTTNTTFPLTGAHTSATCASCHGDGVYAGKSTDCYSCHTAAYVGASNPPHNPTDFPTATASCTGCHNTTAWQPSTFSHANTAFALTGAHPAVACTGCHNASTWSVQGTDCASCHMADYNGTTNPPHSVAGGFPTTGCVCHTTATWSGATAFDHASVGFPLNGMHAVPPRACVDCHSTGYVATSTACVSCHRTSSPGYATGPPAHNETYFPSATCTTCHAAAASGLVTWTGGTFATHTWFPITSGSHNVPCMSCHTASTDLTQYNCSVACHQGAVSQHQAVSNACGTFSTATVGTMCFCCHKSGRAG